MTVEASRTRVVWEYAPAPESTDHVRLRDRYGLFIDGAFAEPADGQWVPTINPATEEPIAEVAWAGQADVARAVDSARAAQPGWAALPARERGK
jgi:aldehyde dehydrogenase (NAD+)